MWKDLWNSKLGLLLRMTIATTILVFALSHRKVNLHWWATLILLPAAIGYEFARVWYRPERDKERDERD